LPYHEVWQKVAAVFDKGHHNDAIEKLFRDRDESAKFDPRMLELVDKLKVHYKVGLLSNNSLSGGKRIRSLGVDKHFDVFLISAEIGLQKPDQEAFKVLYEGLGVAPSEMIFIDDSESSLRTAQEIGFQPILFTTYESLLQKLEELEISI
jgi:putative hydrolase of the HAD superfamily